MSTAALVKVQDAPGTSRSLAMLRPVANPAEIIDVQNETREFVHKALKEGRDFGKVPGVDRKTLLKPGAERVALGFGCHYGEPEILEREIDHDRRVEWRKVKAIWKGPRGNRRKDGEEVTEGVSFGLYRYVVKVPLIHTETGRVVAVGVASCSTMESKYIDRPRDSENTALKMAHKRALVAACLLGFGLSDEFTQDMEDAPIADAGDSSNGDGASQQAESVATFPFGDFKGMAPTDGAVGLDAIVAAIDWCSNTEEKRDKFTAFIDAAWKAIPEKIATCADDQLVKVHAWATKPRRADAWLALTKETGDAIHARGLDHQPTPKDATTGTFLDGQKQEEAQQLEAKLTPNASADPNASAPAASSASSAAAGAHAPSTTQSAPARTTGSSAPTPSASTTSDQLVEAERQQLADLIKHPACVSIRGMIESEIPTMNALKIHSQLIHVGDVIHAYGVTEKKRAQGRAGQAARKANEEKRAAAAPASDLSDDDLDDALGGDAERRSWDEGA